MKKRGILCTVLALTLIVALATVALAVAGGSDDPLVALSYLTGTYKQELLAQAQTQIDTRVSEASGQLGAQLDSIARAAGQTDAPSESGFWRTTVSAGGYIAVEPGTELLFLSGTAVVASGSLSDSTAGMVVPAGTALEANHLYIGLNAGEIRVDYTADVLIGE